MDPTKAKAIRRGKSTFDDVVNRQLHEDRMHKGLGNSATSRKITNKDNPTTFNHPLPGVSGTIHSLIVVDQYVIATTRERKVYCFSAPDQKPSPIVQHWPPPGKDSYPQSNVPTTCERRPSPCRHQV
ncbi:MAG: hypothetical protein P8N76_17130 [Pirellulaceae bacterium]|nr:hypothetical protein [Pirellulaceae bacterium]